MGLFGWSYPPGAANDPRAPWNQVDPPCEVCGSPVDDCICPECPSCGEQGNPACYGDEGTTHKVYHRDRLHRTLEQAHGAALLEDSYRQQAAADKAESDYWNDPQRKVEDAELEAYWRELEAHQRGRT